MLKYLLTISLISLILIPYQPYASQTLGKIVATFQIKNVEVKFIAVPQEGYAPLQVTFIPYSNATGKVEYIWDFQGDGKPDLTTKDQREVVYTYNETGIYKATLIVKGEKQLGSYTQTIKVHKPPIEEKENIKNLRI